MNVSSPVINPVTSLAVAPAILAAANLLLSHLERGQRVDAVVLRSAMEGFLPRPQGQVGEINVDGQSWQVPHEEVNRRSAL